MAAIIRIPGVTYGPAPKAEAKAAVLHQPVDLVVVHDTGNPNSDKEDEAHFSSTRTDAVSRWTSCHGYADALGVLGSCRLDRQAWAAYNYANANGWHIEMCKPGGVVSAATKRNAAALVRLLCELGGVPMVKLTPAQVARGDRGVCGHLDITVGLKVGNHTDPGPNFDWAGFMAQVTNSTAPVAPARTGDEEMAVLMRYRNHPAVFHTNGITAVWVRSQQEILDRVGLGSEGSLSTHVGHDSEWEGPVRLVADRNLIGVIVGEVPPGWEPAPVKPIPVGPAA